MKNIYKTISIFNCLFFLFFSSLSQPAPVIQWQNTIGGSGDDDATFILQTVDGGYVIAGYSISNISGDKTENSCNNSFDYWIIKMDSSGNILWQNTIAGDNGDVLESIQQTSDGGYILAGNSSSGISCDKMESGIGSSDYWIVKTDSMGVIQWQNTIGGNGFEALYSIKQTTDGGYILGGYSASNMSGDKTEDNWDTTLTTYDYWVVKTDSLGNIQWDNTIGGTNFDFLLSVQQTIDGGFILGGYSNSNISGDKTENNWNNSYDYWIVKINSLGFIQWQKTIGGNNWDGLWSLEQTTDKGYILAGNSTSNISGNKTENSWNNSYDYWIVKTDSLGNIQWQNDIGGGSYDQLSSAQQTADAGYILGGLSNSNLSGDKTENSLGNDDYWIIKTDSVGNIQWQNTIGGSNIDQLFSIQQTMDAAYIMAGRSLSNISGDKTENSKGSFDYWIVKLTPDTVTATIHSFDLHPTVSLFPNPVIDQITIRNLPFKGEAKVRVLDLYGHEEIIEQLTILETKTLSFHTNVNQLNNGIYVIEIVVGNKVVRAKFVKE